jgi:hypothetical protein
MTGETGKPNLGYPACRLPFSHGCDRLLNGIIGFINKALI